MHLMPRGAARLLPLALLLLAACSEQRQPAPAAPLPATPAPQPSEAALFPETTDVSQETTASAPPAEPAPPSEIAVNVSALERRFLTAPNDPAARIAALRELADATPAAALTLLNRLFPIEHREDVKSEMLAVLSDLDHAKERDYQFALCTKALAAGQPARIRYLAIHTLADLHDPRARALLIPLQNDPDPDLRTAATRALRDLAP